MFTEKEMKSFENKILNMDCLDFLKKCPDKYFSLILTDPPYGIKADKGSSGFGVQDGRKYSGDWDSKIPEKIIFDEMLRVAKKRNHIWWQLFHRIFEADEKLDCVG